jgi:superfamily II DNA or RNA helicase
MVTLQIETIQHIADSPVIFKRGEFLQKNGAFHCLHEKSGDGLYVYEVDGNYGNYRTEIQFNSNIVTRCDCPYPGRGCKHVVAILLELFDQMGSAENQQEQIVVEKGDYLVFDEIRQQALKDRKQRGKREELTVIQGDMFKGDHLVTTVKGRQYQVTLHDPAGAVGHCSCPDFHYNKLGICKHLLFLSEFFKDQTGFSERVSEEVFPYIDIFWDGAAGRPKLFCERNLEKIDVDLARLLGEMFDEHKQFRKKNIANFIPYLNELEKYKLVQVQEPVLEKLASGALDWELAQAAGNPLPELSQYLKIVPYPYQKEGIKFGLYKKAVLIGDEMGLGKTLQAIGLGILKKEIFGFSKVLVVTLSSLKQQWQREIERFTDENGCIIEGSAVQRKKQYDEDTSLFKITNYEAVLRDVTIISRFRPDLIILDEAQRIKNFETKTAEAVKSLPRQHAMILTGTPLENKLEDVYSLVQFLDPDLLSPLWQFAADHFLLSRKKKGVIQGYINLDKLHQKLKPLVIRRRKEEVLKELPDLIVNDYFVDLYQEQAEIHAGYSQSLLPLLNKKFLTPMDLRRIQALLLKMRQVCDSTYLIDRQTNISPKLKELETILEELVIQNGRKVVIFSEWIAMTFLIGKHLSRAGIPFVELSGKIPVKKRQALIDEFSSNPDCKVFLSTDAGGTGLNLQAADCVINFELPWNPAKVNQRVGRINRIGQASKCLNVVNLIAKNSIEERILAGIKLKEELFSGVFDGGTEEVMFSKEKRQEMVNRLRDMIGEQDEMPQPESYPAVELAEDTPHFLNPEVLHEEADFVGEERGGQLEEVLPDEDEDVLASHPAEKMEEVLNQGMSFIGSLLEMATGKKIDVTGSDDKMVSLDKETGEVTLKFKLPGF